VTELFSRSFDDLAEGMRFTTRGRTVTEHDVVAFASLTGDFHPQHVDAAWSAEGPFGERVAHGLLVLSYAAGLVPFEPERVMALRAVRDAVFKRPVKLGDTIRVEGRIASLKPVDDAAGLVSVALRVNTDRLVMTGTVELVWRRGQEPVSDSTEEPLAGVVPL